MRQLGTGQSQSTPLARLIEQSGRTPCGPGLWERLDMAGVARRLIHVARLAAAEHAMTRLEEAIRRRNDPRGTGPAAQENE